VYVGVGEKIDDLEGFVPARVAGRILGMGDVVGLVETAQQKISEHEAQAAYEKMVLGDFTLEDMLQQLRMIQRLGPMKKVLGMLPGMSQLGDLDQLVDDKRFKRMEALFTSMTPKERLHPDVIDMSRRRRIARGAGQDPNAVGELLKAHVGMKRMMKEMNRLGMGAKLGMKQKKDALRSMSPTGELAADTSGGGLFGGLGGLGDLFGGGAPRMGGGGGLLGGMGGLGGGMGRPGRPMGSSPTRQSGSKRKKDKRKKRR
jgi:signal recognition particle subunit SRP54